MNDIQNYYLKNNGGFWIAVNNEDDVIGTLGLMNKGDFGVLKKFFVNFGYRGKELGIAAKMYKKLLEHAKNNNMKAIVLDTPAACKRARRFYIKNGFEMISKDRLPVKYDYPDRNSDIFIKYL